MINNTFTEVIQKAFQKKPGGKDHKLVQDVSKEYKLPTTSTGKLKIEPKDEKAFKMLVGKKPMTSGVGYGEVAIYWLYNYHKKNREETGHIKKERLELNQGGNEPDLKFAPSGPALEIKAYDSANMVSLGRFQDSLRTFIEVSAPILGVRNLVRTGTVTLLNLNHESLIEASSDFCDLRGAIMELPKARREKYEIFKNMIKKFEEFDAIANSIGLKDCAFQKSGLQPGGEYIAYRLSQYAISEATKVKPGDGQFIVVVAGSKGSFDDSKGVAMIKLNQADISKDPKVLAKGYKFKGGAFMVDFKRVFGQL